ncbi:aspartyl-phosphate phosphatase Spo0E family protein, partial [Paenibacillus sp.]
NFQHPAVIKQSMVLDELINQYNRTGEQIKKPIG